LIESAPSLGISLAVAVGFSRHSGSRASLSWLVRRCVLRAPSLTADPRPSRITRKSYGPRVSNRTMVAKLDHCFCFVGFGTDRLRCQEAMKTADRENSNRWALLASNRAYGAVGQHKSRSIKWAAKQEKVQPTEKCFFLTSPFIELVRTNPSSMSESAIWPKPNIAVTRGNLFPVRCCLLTSTGG